MEKVCLIGAAGTVGRGIARKLEVARDCKVLHVETGAGVGQLKDWGYEPVPLDDALTEATVVILAVPDDVIAPLALLVGEKVQAGGLLIVPDAVAAYAGQLPRREGLATFVTHPCHPSVFAAQGDANRERDYFGGASEQAIVCCLVHGTSLDFDRGEALAKIIWGPVTKSHRVTLEQMILLEPVLSEVVALACVAVVKEALEEVIRRGVPSEAARDFVVGHLNLDLAAVFGEIDDTLSASAHRMLEAGKAAIIQPSWRTVFEPEAIAGFMNAILKPERPQ